MLTFTFRAQRWLEELMTPPDLNDEEGAATAEYAITVLAAAAFAGLLLAIFKSGSVKDLLLGIIQSALAV